MLWQTYQTYLLTRPSHDCSRMNVPRARRLGSRCRAARPCLIAGNLPIISISFALADWGRSGVKRGWSLNF